MGRWAGGFFFQRALPVQHKRSAKGLRAPQYNPPPAAVARGRGRVQVRPFGRPDLLLDSVVKTWSRASDSGKEECRASTRLSEPTSTERCFHVSLMWAKNGTIPRIFAPPVVFLLMRILPPRIIHHGIIHHGAAPRAFLFTAFRQAGRKSSYFRRRRIPPLRR